MNQHRGKGPSAIHKSGPNRRRDGVAIRHNVLRDNLDENGCGSRSVEAAAGSEVMIVLMIELRKDFLWSPFFDCR